MRAGRAKRIRLQIAVIATVLAIFGGCSQQGKRTQIQLSENAKAAGPKDATLTPHCPTTNVAMLQPSAPHTGHHRVMLSWNASTASTNPEDNAVGYCLYRSRHEKWAKKNPRCSDCEQINTVPVTATACVDDLVEDGKTYFYVAAAINQDGSLSASSNEVKVTIPAGSHTSANPNKSVGMCRESASLQTR